MIEFFSTLMKQFSKTSVTAPYHAIDDDTYYNPSMSAVAVTEPVLQVEESTLHARTMEALESEEFPLWFKNWISNNWEIWECFNERALQMSKTGVQHYSAYTIVEVMRWETNLREVNSKFKISNNAKPCLARLFEAVNPSLTGFFKMKGRI